MVSATLVERALEQIKRSTANYEYFFENLQSPDWLVPLRDRGFFASPPRLVREGDSVSIPWWPASRYLARMARDPGAASLVLEIAKAIPETENARVHYDLAQVAVVLPPELGAALVPNAKTWLRCPYKLLLPEQLGRLVERLARGGKVDAALDLAGALLDVVPDVRAEAGSVGGRRSGREACARFDAWNYAEIINNHVPALVDAARDRAVALLADLLQKAVEFSGGDLDDWDDYSWIWRPAIEDHEQNSGHSVKDALVSGVRDSAVQVLRRDVVRVPWLIETLEARRWTIFRRIALHIAATFAPEAVHVAEVRLRDRRLFEDVTVRHEYFRLSSAAFALVSPLARDEVLAFIEEGPDANLTAERLRHALGREPTEEEALRYKRSWQLGRLSAFKDALPPVWAERWQRWSAEYNAPEHPDFTSYHWSGWVGSRSPRTVTDLQGMTPAELVEYLRTWEPSGDWRGPSREGLAGDLRELVTQDPAKYASAARGFKGLRPVYVRSLFAGLHAAAARGREFEWGALVELVGWVLEHDAAKVRLESGLADEDATFAWTRKAIADLLVDALRHEERFPPRSMRNEIWSVLERLAADPDPTPEDEERYGPPNMEPFTMSFNTTRGQAIRAVIEFVSWLSQGEDAPAEPRVWVTAVPEARELLEEHLRPDREPSSAIRSVYGEALPKLAYLDFAWAKQHVRAIFPSDPAQANLRTAAWNAYIGFCRPQVGLFRLLREEYAHAVSSLRVRGIARDRSDPNERLAEHLMALYWWGELGLEAGSLVSLFFSVASEELRSHAIDFIGRSLSEGERPPDEVIVRLQALWEARLAAARKEPSKHVKELSGFGWWFVSASFDEGWAMANLRAVVALTKKIEPGHTVIERLADLAATRPSDAVAAFEELVQADRQGWLVTASREDAERLLRVALLHPESRQLTTDVLHRLGARGFSEFRGLLREGRKGPSA